MYQAVPYSPSVLMTGPFCVAFAGPFQVALIDPVTLWTMVISTLIVERIALSPWIKSVGTALFINAVE